MLIVVLQASFLDMSLLSLMFLLSFKSVLFICDNFE